MMRDVKKIERLKLAIKALQSLGALQMLAELLEIDDFETHFTDPEGEAGYTVSDLLSELAVRFSTKGTV